MKVVVMGVTGCGKTSVGTSLAAYLKCPFFDADDFHPPENVAKMSRGVPLDDNDRESWLAALGALLAEHDKVVLACSALKAKYREQLAPARDVRYVYLRVSPAIAASRVKARANHYMPTSLVASQFEILEEPQNALRVDAEAPIETVVDEIVSRLHATPLNASEPGEDM